MNISVLDYLDRSADRFPDKAAFCDQQETLTFDQLREMSRRIGTAISDRIGRQEPVIVYMEKRAVNIAVFMGIAAAGCFYVPMDAGMPEERVHRIMDCLHPGMIICEQSTERSARAFAGEVPVLLLEDAVKQAVKEEALAWIRAGIKSTDLIYVLFTSGSTGIPKGVTISHAAVLDLTEWICERYSLDENTALCNQAPFYFDASVPDILIPLKTGATTYIPPKSYYTFPKKVLQYVREHRINTLIWVPSALCNVVNCHAFDVCVPDTVQRVIFCGEVMPCRHLKVWRQKLPDARFVNMYGPTEATYACMYYEIERDFDDTASLPLGKACANSDILLLNEEQQPVQDGEIGEICILGQCLSSGYYNNKEKTQEAFVQNPVNPNWVERMYRTGDLARYDENGDMIFVGRKDFQIKRLGHRIELGEIEHAILGVEGVLNVCCLYDESRSEIIAVYSGKVDEDDMLNRLKAFLPVYMMPNRMECIDEIPLNMNGKVDRAALRKRYGKG